MPGYIMKALLRFCHMKTIEPQRTASGPNPTMVPNNNAWYDPDSPELSDDGLKRLQESSALSCLLPCNRPHTCT
jgi:hypothetical protein